MTKNRSADYRFVPFLIITAIHLMARLMDFNGVAGLSKSLLMPLLIVIVLKSTNQLNRPFLLIGALCLSWIGDVLLLFTERDEFYFIGGLIAFLLAHICYILLFRQSIRWKQIKTLVALFGGVLILGYLSFMLRYLHPLVDSGLFPAIVVYAVIISVMFYTALLQYKSPLPPSTKLIQLGALLFILSDTLLALEKFGNLQLPVHLTGFLIMLTYCSAQAAITKGSLLKMK